MRLATQLELYNRARGSQAPIQFQWNGGNLGTIGTVSLLNFSGTGVTATRSANSVTVAIPSGNPPIQFKDEGNPVSTPGAFSAMNFVGPGLIATDGGGGTLLLTLNPTSIDHNTLGNLTTGDPHTQYVKKAGDTMTGTLNTLALIPVANQTSSIGTTSLRYLDLNFSQLKGFYDNTTGTPPTYAVTFNPNSSGIFSSTGSNGTRTFLLGNTTTASFMFASQFTDLADTLTHKANGFNCVNMSHIYSPSGLGSTGGNVLESTSSGNGSVLLGVCSAIFANTASVTFKSRGAGSVVAGLVTTVFSTGATAVMDGSGDGSNTTGNVVAFLGQTSKLLNASFGGTAGGYVTRGIVSFAGAGSLLTTRTDASVDTAVVSFTGAGSIMSLNNAAGSGIATMSGNGSIMAIDILGTAAGTLSGSGSLLSALVTTVAAVCSGNNSLQLGPGTNAENDTLQLGILGNGIRMRGTTTAFTSPTNGDIRQNSSASVEIRSASIVRNVSKLHLCLSANITAVGTTGTGEETLQTYTIPAATQATNADTVAFSMWFATGANADTKRIKVKYGGTTIYDSTAQAVNNGSLVITGRIVRTGTATQKCYVEAISSDPLFPSTVVFTAAAETMANAIAIFATGQTNVATANNIVQNYLSVDLQALTA